MAKRKDLKENSQLRDDEDVKQCRFAAYCSDSESESELLVQNYSIAFMNGTTITKHYNWTTSVGSVLATCVKELKLEDLKDKDLKLLCGTRVLWDRTMKLIDLFSGLEPHRQIITCVVSASVSPHAQERLDFSNLFV